MERLAVTLAFATALTFALAACGDGVIDAGPLEDGEVTSTPVPDGDESDGAGEESDEGEPSSTDPEGSGDDGVDEADGTGSDRETTDADDAGDTTAVRLYFMAPGGDTPARADPFLIAVHRELPATPAIAEATLRALIDGPTADDASLLDGLSSSVPSDTLLIDIDIADGLATVDLSREFESGGGSLSMRSRLAQVVYTATQFPTVDEVRFRLDGQPVTVFSGEGIELDGPVSRDDLVELLPTVFVDTPSAGAEVAGGSLRMTGVAAVFEATFQYRLATADGTVLDEGFAMTDDGLGWGAFDVTIPYEVDGRQEAVLTVWEESAKDGSDQAKRATPLVLLP